MGDKKNKICNSLIACFYTHEVFIGNHFIIQVPEVFSLINLEIPLIPLHNQELIISYLFERMMDSHVN